jgi:hypothetical protein
MMTELVFHQYRETTGRLLRLPPIKKGRACEAAKNLTGPGLCPDLTNFKFVIYLFS